MDYRLTNREFSRVWRRSKRYSDHELKWLCRRRGLALRREGKDLKAVDPKTNKVVVRFEPIPVAMLPEPPPKRY
jgi:hypothetical protein